MDGDLAAVHAVEADFWIIGLSEASLLLAIFRIIEKQNIVVIGEGLRNSGFFGSRRLISCLSLSADGLCFKHLGSGCT